MARYTLKKVQTEADEKVWLHADRAIYKGYSNWVCPLDDDIRKVFDPARNEKLSHGEAIRWVAIDTATDRVVGRIAAFYDANAADEYEQPTGGCGFFECIDDQCVANMLFDASRKWLTSKGMEAMDGPINFGSRDNWWGLLVDGFDYPPLYGNQYHPPYYKALFENYGFQNYFNQNSYIWKIGEDRLSEVAIAKAERIEAAGGYRVEDVRDTDLNTAAQYLRTIYNQAWALFTGVKPMTEQQAQQMVDTLRPIIDRDIIYFAYHNDTPIGFFVMVPDLNCIIGKFKGRFGIINKLRLLWNLKVRHAADRMFGIIFGIAPQYQGKGVESLIMRHILETYVRSGRSKYKAMEFAWIGDFNPVMNKMIENYLCAKRHKMHATYRYLFDRSKPFTRCPRVGIVRSKE